MDTRGPADRPHPSELSPDARPCDEPHLHVVLPADLVADARDGGVPDAESTRPGPSRLAKTRFAIRVAPDRVAGLRHPGLQLELYPGATRGSGCEAGACRAHLQLPPRAESRRAERRAVS